MDFIGGGKPLDAPVELAQDPRSTTDRQRHVRAIARAEGSRGQIATGRQLARNEKRRLGMDVQIHHFGGADAVADIASAAELAGYIAERYDIRLDQALDVVVSTPREQLSRDQWLRKVADHAKAEALVPGAPVLVDRKTPNAIASGTTAGDLLGQLRTLRGEHVEDASRPSVPDAAARLPESGALGPRASIPEQPDGQGQLADPAHIGPSGASHRLVPQATQMVEHSEPGQPGLDLLPRGPGVRYGVDDGAAPSAGGVELPKRLLTGDVAEAQAGGTDKAGDQIRGSELERTRARRSRLGLSPAKVTAGKLAAAKSVAGDPGTAASVAARALADRVGQGITKAVDRVPGLGAARALSQAGSARIESARLVRSVQHFVLQLIRKLIISTGIGAAGAFLVNLLPIKNPLVRYVVSLGTGCAGQCAGCCGCSCGCSTFGFVFAAIILLTFALGGSSPAFMPPLFCGQGGAIACSQNGTVAVQVDPSEVPPDALLAYKEVEKQTGIPWFYFVAWEKVSTNFGTIQTLHHGTDTPAMAQSVALEDARQASKAAGDDEGQGTMSGSIGGQIVADRQEQIDRLNSDLRGGSFGINLTTNDEYDRFGKDSEGNYRDPFDRQDSGMILANHLAARFVSKVAEGPLTSTETPTLQQIDKGVAEYVTQTMLTKVVNGDKTTLAILENYAGVDRYGKPIDDSALKPVAGASAGAGGGGLSGVGVPSSSPAPGQSEGSSAQRNCVLMPSGSTICTDSQKPAASPGASPAPSTPVKTCTLNTVTYQESCGGAGESDNPALVWSDGPESGSGLTLIERSYVCTSLANMRIVESVGSCRRFNQPPVTLNPPKDSTLRDFIKTYYTPNKGAGNAGTVSDWDKLQGLMGAMFADREFWGSEKSAVVSMPALDATGRPSGDTVEINSYAQAIITYARQLYEGYTKSFATDTATVRNWGALTDLEARDFVFWGPVVDEISRETKVRRAYLFATLDTMGVFTCQYEDPAFSLSEISQRAKEPATWQEGVDYVGMTDGRLVDARNPGGLSGCWRFGDGLGARWGKETSALADQDLASVKTPAVATNRCTVANRMSDGTCGVVQITLLDDSGNPTAKTVTAPVTGFADLASGTDARSTKFPDKATERVAALNGAALDALGVGSTGDFHIRMSYVASTLPAEAAAAEAAGSATSPSASASPAPSPSPIPTPGVVAASPVPGASTAPASTTGFPPHMPWVIASTTPEDAIRALAKAMMAGSDAQKQSRSGNTKDFVPYWQRTPIPVDSCTIDPQAAKLAVKDAYTKASLGAVDDCTYLDIVVNLAYQYADAEAKAAQTPGFTVNGGSIVTSAWGREQVSPDGWIWPMMDVYMSDGFSARNGYAGSVKVQQQGSSDWIQIHDGIDIIKIVGAKSSDFPCGHTPVVAAFDGTAEYVQDPGSAGTADDVHLYNPAEDLYAMYGHLNGVLPDEVQALGGNFGGGFKRDVKAGDILAYMGTTGATGCHLHFTTVLQGKNYSHAWGDLDESPDWSFEWMGKPAIYRTSGQFGAGWTAPRVDPLHFLPHDNVALPPRGGSQRANGLFCAYAPSPALCYPGAYKDNAGWPHYLDPDALKKHQLVLLDADATLTYATPLIAPDEDPVLVQYFAQVGEMETSRDGHPYGGWNYTELMLQVSNETGLSPYLLAALVHVESSFHIDSHSGAEAYGLTQITPVVAYECKLISSKTTITPADVPKVEDPYTNLHCGAWDLETLIKGSPGGRVDIALWCYNAGVGYVASKDYNIDAENPSYPKAVLDAYQHYLQDAKKIAAANTTL